MCGHVIEREAGLVITQLTSRLFLTNATNDSTCYHVHMPIARSIKEVRDENLWLDIHHLPEITLNIKRLYNTALNDSDSCRPAWQRLLAIFQLTSRVCWSSISSWFITCYMNAALVGGRVHSNWLCLHYDFAKIKLTALHHVNWMLCPTYRIS